ncbi:hypothetical protein KGP36_01935 [Patescibacteria group bacterium]|nr:hypothetical protein [Patescibacteria group bacterium]
MQALKNWAAEQSDATGVALDTILADAGKEFAPIVRKSNFLQERRKEIEARMAARRGEQNPLLTQPLPENKDQRILAEPEYMVLLNDDLSDPSHYSTPLAKHVARQNRAKLDRATATVAAAEEKSKALKRRGR